MDGKILASAVAVATVVLGGPSWAGGGFHGGFRPAAPRPVMAGPRGLGGGAWRGGMRPMPPVAGVIHERPGARPFYSAFGHVDTGYRGGGWALRPGAGGFRPDRYGHVGTGFPRYGRERFAARRDRERLADGRRVGIYRFGRGYSGYGGSLGGSGGTYDVGGAAYPGEDGTGQPSPYASPGSYGTLGTEAGGGGAYLSEPPLAATHAEAPLAPSPYGADDGYYAPGNSGIAPHILTVDRSSPAGCGCGPGRSAYPAIYRYGVGTAY